MEFVQSFTEYNNIEKMVVRYKDAYELLERPSRFNLLDEAWTSKVEKYGQEMFAAIQPYCHIIYVKHLLINKSYNEIYGLTSTFIDMANDMNYILPQVYHYLYLAIAKKMQGKLTEVQEYMINALNLALPDKVYLPFAENATYILPMLEEGGCSVFDGVSLREVMKLCRKQEAGFNAVKKTFSRIKTVLTARETEVAILAKEGYAVKKIAQMLFISDATVKTILKNVYFKLDIHSKVQLGKIDL